MTVTIECSDIQTKEDFHRKFSKSLYLPGFYGNNLDALYDCLTDPRPEKARIRMKDFGALAAALGPDAHKFAAVLSRAAAENPDVEFVFEK